jgi:hypothetical protein
MINITSAIYQLYPTVVRTVGEDAYDTDGNPVIYDRTLVEVEAQRMSARQSRALAYATEADPLAFKYLRDEVDLEEWKAKIAEIRTRYPYPTEVQS